MFVSAVGAESLQGRQGLWQDTSVRVPGWVPGEELGWGAWELGLGALTWLVKAPLAHTPEPEVTIVRGLADTEVQADGEAEFSCEVSRAGVDVEWRLQGLPLQSNEVTEVAVQGGRTHTLRLKSVTPEDAGTVSFHAGGHTSSAQLTVRGSRSRASLHLRARTPPR